MTLHHELFLVRMGLDRVRVQPDAAVVRIDTTGLLDRRQEELERRLREFRLAAAPLVKAMVRLEAIAAPKYAVTILSDGMSSDIKKIDDGMTPEMRQQMKWLQDQHAALARSYGFDIAQESP